MSSKSRAIVANTVIGAVTLAGGVLLTDHYTASSGGFASIFGVSNSSGGPLASGEQRATGDAIPYAYGTIQLEVVKTNGKLTAVNLVQATATAGREQAFSYLQQYAVDAQGSSFGNLSGATYTTDTFKQALDSALSKVN